MVNKNLPGRRSVSGGKITSEAENDRRSICHTIHWNDRL